MTVLLDTPSFRGIIPSSIGYDNIFEHLERLTKTVATAGATQTYPPYNIKKTSDNEYLVELAVAGFTEAELDIELQESVLTIKGSTHLSTELEDGVEVTYLHKGIANRDFVRKFTLADTVEIEKADLVNGMLKIYLKNVIPDNKKPRKIEIGSPKSQLLTE